MNHSLNYTDKLNETIKIILDLSGAELEIDSVKKDLFSAAYLNFILRVAQSPENKGLIEHLSSQSRNISSYGEFERVINETKEKLRESDFDAEGALKSAISEVLNDFITELEPTLAPEKVAEIRKTVSEGI